MRTFELKRFAPLRCANVLAVVTCCVYGVLALIAAPLMAGALSIATKASEMSATARHAPMPTLPPAWLPLAFAVIYPVIGAVMGWIFGGLGALAYNLVVQYIGGIEVQLDETPIAPT
jgi:hypothetical protein